MKIVRPVISTVGGIGSRVRDMGRLQAVARVLVRHGFGWLVSGLEIPGLGRSDKGLQTTPERVTRVLTELGPTFVKLGQILSTRPDALPEAYCEALSKLQDDVDALPYESIRETLDAELGDHWTEQIDLDEAPLATASIAQVHIGTLTDGSRVVLKVQRQGIGATIRADLNILELLAHRLLSEVPEAESFDPLGMLSEFERSITAELDFVQEAEQMERFRRNFADDEDIIIPDVYDALTSRRVLCMDFMDGVKIRDARAAGSDMQVVGDRYLRAAYDMLFVHGLFHGDLHPGNVIVLPGDRIGLIDFGMVGRMTNEMRNNVISIMFALQRGDYRTIARLFYDIAIKKERLDYAAVERETIEVMEEHWSAGGSVKDMQLGPFMMGLAVRAARQGCRIPSNYTMLFKSIMTSEGLAKSLIEEVDPIAAIQPYFQQMIAERFGRANMESELFYHSFTLQTMLSRLPVTLSQFMDDMDAQRLRVSIQNIADQAELDAADRRANRQIAAGLTAICALCGTAALISPAAWPFGVPIVAIAFYLLTVPLFGLAALMMLRNRG